MTLLRCVGRSDEAVAVAACAALCGCCAGSPAHSNTLCSPLCLAFGRLPLALALTACKRLRTSEGAVTNVCSEESCLSYGTMRGKSPTE